MMPPNNIQVIKQDHLGNEVFRYPGRIISLNKQAVQLEAEFGFAAVPIGEVVLRRGDRFIETFYFDRWYNIFEIRTFEGNLLKAYYCNIGYPAILTKGEISYRDLAIDLLVMPDGHQTVLDMDEFEELSLDSETRRKALDGLAQLQAQMAAIFHAQE
jgi:predicted RNA-binding protein associated with RNAse of E/G family